MIGSKTKKNASLSITAAPDVVRAVIRTGMVPMKKVYTQRADPNLGPSTGPHFQNSFRSSATRHALPPPPRGVCLPPRAERIGTGRGRQNAPDRVAGPARNSAGRFSRPHVVPGRPLEARGTCHPRSVGTLHGARTRDPTAGPLACRGISFRGRSTARRTVHDGAARRAGNAAASRCVCERPLTHSGVSGESRGYTRPVRPGPVRWGATR